MKLTIVLLLVMALVASGCAGGDVLDGTDVNQQGEASQETSSAPEPDETVSTEEPSEGAHEPDSSDAIPEAEPPEQEETDGTALVTSTTVDKSSAGTPTPEETVPPAGAEGGLVATAKEDLANRLGIAADSIEVVSVQEVDWPDASIGCPQPDMVYAQVITNGSRIILSHNGDSYHYHSASMGDPFYCENPADPVPGSET